MKPVYLLWQWLWGLPQNLAGLCLMLRHRKERHVWYHGSYMTFFHTWCGGVSLGMFTFVSEYDERMQEAFAREGSRLTESYQAEQDKTEALYEALEAAESALSEASE